MSAKSSRPSKKLNLPPPTPRAKDQIEADYGRVVAQVGQLQYQLHVYGKELTRLNGELENLNYEAAARNQLDAKAAPAATATPTTPTEAVGV